MATESQHPARINRLAGTYDLTIGSDLCGGIFAEVSGIKGAIEADSLDELLRKVGKEIAKQDRADGAEDE